MSVPHPPPGVRIAFHVAAAIVFIYLSATCFYHFLNREHTISLEVNTLCLDRPSTWEGVHIADVVDDICDAPSPYRFRKFIWLATDGWAINMNEGIIDALKEHSHTYAINVPGVKWSHAIYTSWATGQPSSNARGKPIKGDSLFKSAVRSGYSMEYWGPEWSFLRVQAPEPDDVFDRIVERWEPTRGYTPPIAYHFFWGHHNPSRVRQTTDKRAKDPELVDPIEPWEDTLDHLLETGRSLIAHSGGIDHKQHGEYSPTTRWPATRSRCRKLAEDILKRVVPWINEHPEYLLILGSDHGVDQATTEGGFYKLHGETEGGNEGFFLVYSPTFPANSQPEPVRMDVVHVAATMASYLQGVDVPASSVGYSHRPVAGVEERVANLQASILQRMVAARVRARYVPSGEVEPLVHLRGDGTREAAERAEHQLVQYSNALTDRLYGNVDTYPTWELVVQAVCATVLGWACVSGCSGGAYGPGPEDEETRTTSTVALALMGPPRGGGGGGGRVSALVERWAWSTLPALLWYGMGFALHYGAGGLIRNGGLAQGVRCLLGVGLLVLSHRCAAATSSVGKVRARVSALHTHVPTGVLLGEAVWWVSSGGKALDSLRFWYYNEGLFNPIALLGAYFMVFWYHSSHVRTRAVLIRREGIYEGVGRAWGTSASKRVRPASKHTVWGYIEEVMVSVWASALTATVHLLRRATASLKVLLWVVVLSLTAWYEDWKNSVPSSSALSEDAALARMPLHIGGFHWAALVVHAACVGMFAWELLGPVLLGNGTFARTNARFTIAPWVSRATARLTSLVETRARAAGLAVAPEYGGAHPQGPPTSTPLLPTTSAMASPRTTTTTTTTTTHGGDGAHPLLSQPSTQGPLEANAAAMMDDEDARRGRGEDVEDGVRYPRIDLVVPINVLLYFLWSIRTRGGRNGYPRLMLLAFNLAIYRGIVPMGMRVAKAYHEALASKHKEDRRLAPVLRYMGVLVMAYMFAATFYTFSALKPEVADLNVKPEAGLVGLVAYDIYVVYSGFLMGFEKYGLFAVAAVYVFAVGEALSDASAVPRPAVDAQPPRGGNGNGRGPSMMGHRHHHHTAPHHQAHHHAPRLRHRYEAEDGSGGARDEEAASALPLGGTWVARARPIKRIVRYLKQAEMIADAGNLYIAWAFCLCTITFHLALLLMYKWHKFVRKWESFPEVTVVLVLLGAIGAAYNLFRVRHVLAQRKAPWVFKWEKQRVIKRS